MNYDLNIKQIYHAKENGAPEFAIFWIQIWSAQGADLTCTQGRDPAINTHLELYQMQYGKLLQARLGMPPNKNWFQAPRYRFIFQCYCVQF